MIKQKLDKDSNILEGKFLLSIKHKGTDKDAFKAGFVIHVHGPWESYAGSFFVHGQLSSVPTPNLDYDNVWFPRMEQRNDSELSAGRRLIEK